MKKNKKVTQAEKIGEGVDFKMPEDLKPMEFIQNMTELLKTWTDQNKERGFVLIAASESRGNGDYCGLSFGCSGSNEGLAKMMCGALEHSRDLQDIVLGACSLKEASKQ